jgi:hypothetical protein
VYIIAALVRLQILLKAEKYLALVSATAGLGLLLEPSKTPCGDRCKDKDGW